MMLSWSPMMIAFQIGQPRREHRAVADHACSSGSSGLSLHEPVHSMSINWTSTVRCVMMPE